MKGSEYMFLYRPVAWKEDEECHFSFLFSHKEARDLGDEFCPSGYDLEYIDTEDDEVYVYTETI